MKIALPPNLRNEALNAYGHSLTMSRVARKVSVPINQLNYLIRKLKVQVGAYSLAPSLGNA